MKTFKDKVVLVTGGNGGIGMEVARLFAQENAVVYLLGRNTKTLQETREKLKGVGGRMEIVAADVSDTQACRQAVEYVVEREEKLDILVNSAGMYAEETIGETSEALWDKLMDVNLKGTYFMCKYAIPYLQKTKGSIVNVASTSGVIGFEGNSLYCASKGGMIMLTKALAIECAPAGIRVNVVSPDMVKTEMLDIGFERSGMQDRAAYNALCMRKYPQREEDRRFVLPEEVAQCVVFFASDNVKAITGANLVIDCGLTAGV